MKKILMFTWFGAKKYQINIFCKLFHNIGVKSEYIKADILKSINPNDWNKWIKEGPKKLNSKKYDYVLIFSGGIFQYHCYTLNNNNIFNHSKIIFDSSPMLPIPEQLSTYVINSMPDQLNYLNNNMINNTFNKLADNYWSFKDYNYKDKYNIFTDNINCGREKLIFIGDNDKFINKQLINNEIIQWEKKNKVIKPSEFTNNGHLNHYKNNPEIYKDTIFNFLNN